MSPFFSTTSLPFPKFAARAILAITLGLAVLPAMLAQETPTTPDLTPYAFTEVLEMSIERIGVDYQGPQVIDLNVSVTFRPGMVQADYPDFEVLYRDLLRWIEAYPTKTDYWETLNKALCAQVLENYPTIAIATLEIVVYPTRTLTYPHTVRTTATRKP